MHPVCKQWGKMLKSFFLFHFSFHFKKVLFFSFLLIMKRCVNAAPHPSVHVSTHRHLFTQAGLGQHLLDALTASHLPDGSFHRLVGDGPVSRLKLVPYGPSDRVGRSKEALKSHKKEAFHISVGLYTLRQVQASWLKIQQTVFVVWNADICKSCNFISITKMMLHFIMCCTCILI